jgi:hypothetical protein
VEVAVHNRRNIYHPCGLDWILYFPRYSWITQTILYDGPGRCISQGENYEGKNSPAWQDESRRLQEDFQEVAYLGLHHLLRVSLKYVYP